MPMQTSHQDAHHQRTYFSRDEVQRKYLATEIEDAELDEDTAFGENVPED